MHPHTWQNHRETASLHLLILFVFEIVSKLKLNNFKNGIAYVFLRPPIFYRYAGFLLDLVSGKHQRVVGSFLDRYSHPYHHTNTVCSLKVFERILKWNSFKFLTRYIVQHEFRVWVTYLLEDLTKKWIIRSKSRELDFCDWDGKGITMIHLCNYIYLLQSLFSDIVPILTAEQ